MSPGSPSTQRYENRVCVITGAGSGIGHAIALRLAAEGGTVIAADIDADAAAQTVAMTGSGRAAKVDVRPEDSVGRMAEAVEAARDPGADIEAPAGAACVEPCRHRDQPARLLRGSRSGQERHGSHGPGRGGDPWLGAAAGGGTSPVAVTYRAELSSRALGQLSGLPEAALDALVATMSGVIEYPDEPSRTFPGR